MKRWVLAASVTLVIGVVFAMLWQGAENDRVEPPNAAREVARCATCHQREAEAFLETPHANTLRPASDSEAIAHFSGQTARVGELSTEFRYTERDGRLWMSGQRLSTPIAVDWIFGSGRHARTPVSVRLNAQGETESLEHHITWYANHGLGLTIDHPESAGVLNEDSGNRHRHDAAVRCFGCHTTELPIHWGKIDFRRVLPGLLCAKCHPGAAEHAQSMERDQKDPRINKWSELTPKQSVAKCAECHRMPFQVSPAERTPQNAGLTRFASIGLLMTRCFHEQEARRDPGGKPVRFDCLTCHDPHRPDRPTAERANQSCRACHHRKNETESDCPQQPLSSNCAGCHMPKVQLPSPIQFTDHWIRVRRADEPLSVTP